MHLFTHSFVPTMMSSVLQSVVTLLSFPVMELYGYKPLLKHTTMLQFSFTSTMKLPLFIPCTSHTGRSPTGIKEEEGRTNSYNQFKQRHHNRTENPKPTTSSSLTSLHVSSLIEHKHIHLQETAITCQGSVSYMLQTDVRFL